MDNQLKALTEAYIEKTDALIAARKFGEGIFGTHDSVKSDPCHMDYFEAIQAEAAQLAASQPSAEDAERAVEFLLKAHASYQCNDVASWSLITIQQTAKPLIPYLSTDAKKGLGDWYRGYYPRFQRMPIQQEICKLLK